MDLPLRCGHTRLHDKCAQCVALQAAWYAILQANGFEDAENTSIATRPLRAWSGVSMQVALSDGEESIDIIDLIVSQEPNAPFQNAFPESPLASHHRLLCHPEFDRLCESLCSHGNHRLIPSQVKDVWVAYIEGGSNRAIAEKLSVNDSVVFRTIRSLTQWMELMDLDGPEEAESISKVVLRKFKPGYDDAFIYASWRNSLWYDDDDRKEGDSGRFYRQATDSIRTILDNPETTTRIACLDYNHDFIVGYSVITGLCLHFVYVKADYRGKRIGSLLVPRNVEAVSPVLTKIGRAIAEKKGFIKKNKENLDGETKEGSS